MENSHKKPIIPPHFAQKDGKDIGYVELFQHKQTNLISDAMIIDTLLNNSQDTVYFKDINSCFILNDKAHAIQFGVKDPNELIGKSDADFYPEIFARQSRHDELLIMKTGVPIINKMEQGMNAAGEILIFSTSKYPLYNINGKIIGTWGVSRDMTKLVHAEEELAKAHAKLQALSLIDDLTGLYNQKHFYESLDMTIKIFTRKRLGGYSADFCLLFIDIDHYKEINDTYGHLIGDSGLRFIAGQMTANTRSEDISFRYGGDEFAMILPNTKLEDGFKIAEKLRLFVETNPMITDSNIIPMTISLGVIDFNNERDASEMVQKADAKLYLAKNEGRNLVR
ncbi:MAG: diguanylate cyclase [Candidatus Izemoplasmatales bacterium]|jgi:diguanylate cyclase (GGDEF)-like protein/PAS domain S-box-containing protein|nr:diguanylate cyclase [Candidatus Izemoplasmatales bacterium]MDD3865625.1 diguanylate cyclase [Candidatus Izemoplasmatales bacterium]